MSIPTKEIKLISTIPNEIIIDEILIRLPVKTLCKFISVCKLWKSVISSTQFVKSHLAFKQSCSNPKWVFFQHKQNSWLLDYEAYDNDNETLVPKHFKIHSSNECIDDGGLTSLGKLLDAHLNGETGNPFGSSCGLVCLLTKDNQICLCNPILGQYRMISVPSVPYGTQGRRILGGFGYVPSMDDFKIVLSLEDRLERAKRMFYVFSLRENNWRIVEPGAGHFLSMAIHLVKWNGILVNEHVHWWIKPLGYSYDTRIVAFDLVSELFELIPIPEALNFSKDDNASGTTLFNGVSAMSGCLCLSVFWEKANMEIWVMKQYGERDSWVKLYDLRVPPSYIYLCDEFFGLTKSGKLLIHCWKRGKTKLDFLCLVDPNKSKRKIFNPTWCFDRQISTMVYYVESLVSPFGFVTPTLQERKGDGNEDTQEGNIINS